MKCRPSSLASIATWQTGQGLDASGGLGRGSRFMIEHDRQNPTLRSTTEVYVLELSRSLLLSNFELQF
jgi:hypothetical protein